MGIGILTFITFQTIITLLVLLNQVKKANHKKL
jgi:hypothetical protein